MFGTLYRAVVEGMWQMLETIPAAVWLIGTAITFWMLLLVGLAVAGIARVRLSGL